AIGMGAGNFRISEQLPHSVRHELVAGERANIMQAWIEGLIRTNQPVNRHRSDQVRRFQQVVKSVQGMHGMARNKLGAVDEGQSFLRTELQRREPQPRQDFGARLYATLVKNFPEANQWEEQVGKGSEIAGSPDGALRRYYGNNIVVHHGDDTLYGSRPDPRKALRQSMYFNDHH